MKKTFAQFAFAYGQTDRLTHEATEHWHEQYLTFDAEQQGEMRVQWLVNYLMGKLKLNETKAQQIVAASRNDRSVAQQQAYDRARGQFTYHIERRVSAKAEPKTAKVRLPSGTVERIAEAYVGLTREQIIAAHNRALAALDFE